MVRSFIVLALLALGALACSDRSSPQGEPTRSGSSAVPPTASAPGSAPSSEGIPCKSDADCPGLACGPCTPGTPIPAGPRPSCFMNPCLHASSVCNAKHICVVGPHTEKDPAVWGSAKPSK
jgi:hypothetical protein